MLPVRLGTLILLVGAPQPRYTGGLKPGQEAGRRGPLTTTYPRVTPPPALPGCFSPISCPQVSCVAAAS